MKNHILPVLSDEAERMSWRLAAEGAKKARIMKNHGSPVLSKEERMARMRQFLTFTEQGMPAPIDLQRWIAEHIVAPVAEGRKPFKTPPHRPQREADAKEHALAYLAAFIDPKFCMLPLSKGKGRYAEVGSLLNISETQARRRAQRYRNDAFGLDGTHHVVGSVPLYDVAAKYAQRRGEALATVQGWIASYQRDAGLKVEHMRTTRALNRAEREAKQVERR